jgi:hypothetical protein
MRTPRLVAVALWLTVAALAVAGFANFTPQAAPQTTTTSTTMPVRGSVPGRVMARALAAGMRSGTETEVVEPVDVAAMLDVRGNAIAPPANSVETTTTTALPATTTTTAAPTSTTTTAPISTTTTTLASSHTPLSKDEARSIFSLFFKPEDVDTALAIAKCESTLIPDNVNERSGAAGLFQHLPKYWAERSAAAGWANADILDPYANTAVAAWLRYEGGGWSHWTCYRG